jgi:ATP-dependent DNA helicase RecG
MSQSTEPAIIPEIEEYAMEDKTVVAITIKQPPLKSTAYKGITFSRIKNSNKKLTPKDVSELYLQTIGSSWDAYSSREVKIEDIDYKKVGFYIKLANETGRRKITEEPLEVLEKLELIKDKGKLTNKDYQDLFFVSKQTATRDLSHLVDLNILQKIGQTGKGTYYVLASKGS